MDTSPSSSVRPILLAVSEQILEGKITDVLSACRFEGIKVLRDSRFATAYRKSKRGNSVIGSWEKESRLELNWEPQSDLVKLNVVAYDAAIGNPKILDTATCKEITEAFLRLVQPSISPSSEVVLMPGESSLGPSRGPIRDYSRCAREEELSDLFHGDLPLGRYAFGRTPQALRHGKPLFLSRFPHTNQPMIYNGVLLCAPQNSGKTELLLTWAAAANRAGYSIFMIDVKGNLRSKLDRFKNTWRGELFHFSVRPGIDSARLNFLAPLAYGQPLDSKRLESLAGAILPAEGWDGEGGEAEMFYQSRLLRLTAFLHILKFRHDYCYKYIAKRNPNGRPGDYYILSEGTAPAIPSLSELYNFATDEELVCFWIKRIAEAEKSLESLGRGKLLPEKRVEMWARDIAPILHPDYLPGIGQRRDPKVGYRDLTYGVALALHPFSEGVLLERTSPSGSGKLFDFQTLNRSKNEHPVSLLLEVGEDDPKQAAAITSLTVRALEPILHTRMHTPPPGCSSTDDWQPLLLLLDETRRIRSFNPIEYITFARERRAACVMVYQSLNLIGTAAEIDTILSNVGTQIYLGKLVGDTATAFSRMLPSEDRKIYVTNESDGSVQSRWEPRPILTAAELYRLPSGNWPALVHIHDLPCRKPFLVDLDQSVVDNQENQR
ncbi:TraM recognition domain-containing protein [Telmatocola sphagniphila]|uniref:TraM recognition domain-containing protein n=1 Tax=Telmatocola sphagniphila TaxID=1123043 RepID=A0A8E6B9K2_9BACT|nr:TraM recognition domain-containing protein [Telmatocola sphagniphila]QVL33914.1 TraM recognition domain-containing protein [Telmatocola sphagniphila]